MKDGETEMKDNLNLLSEENKKLIKEFEREIKKRYNFKKIKTSKCRLDENIIVFSTFKITDSNDKIDIYCDKDDLDNIIILLYDEENIEDFSLDGNFDYSYFDELWLEEEKILDWRKVLNYKKSGDSSLTAEKLLKQKMDFSLLSKSDEDYFDGEEQMKHDETDIKDIFNETVGPMCFWFNVAEIHYCDTTIFRNGKFDPEQFRSILEFRSSKSLDGSKTQSEEDDDRIEYMFKQLVDFDKDYTFEELFTLLFNELYHKQNYSIVYH
jgi:hypothetical protein